MEENNNNEKWVDKYLELIVEELKTRMQKEKSLKIQDIREKYEKKSSELESKIQNGNVRFYLLGQSKMLIKLLDKIKIERDNEILNINLELDKNLENDITAFYKKLFFQKETILNAP